MPHSTPSCLPFHHLFSSAYSRGRWGAPGERRTERAGAKRQTFHGHGEQNARQARDGRGRGAKRRSRRPSGPIGPICPTASSKTARRGTADSGEHRGHREDRGAQSRATCSRTQDCQCVRESQGATAHGSRQRRAREEPNDKEQNAYSDTGKAPSLRRGVGTFRTRQVALL